MAVRMHSSIFIILWMGYSQRHVLIRKPFKGALVLWKTACCCRVKSRGGEVGLGWSARDFSGTEEAECKLVRISLLTRCDSPESCGTAVIWDSLLNRTWALPCLWKQSTCIQDKSQLKIQYETQAKAQSVAMEICERGKNSSLAKSGF